jgi:DNA modification methylase
MAPASVAGNVLEYGVGGLNIDACRVGYPIDDARLEWMERYGGRDYPDGRADVFAGALSQRTGSGNPQGRWPANTVLAHHPDCGDTCHPDCWVTTLDGQSGVSRSSDHRRRSDGSMGYSGQAQPFVTRGVVDAGGASRFFPTFRYEAKAPTRERPKVDGVAHPTVKPLALMRWLCRLVTPPGGTILDPFLGSGTTAEAAELEGFRWVGCEQNTDYLPLIQVRLDRVADVQLRLPA